MNGTYPSYPEPYGYDFYPDRFSNSSRSSAVSSGNLGRKPFHKVDKDGRQGSTTSTIRQERSAAENGEQDEEKASEDEKQPLEEEFVSSLCLVTIYQTNFVAELVKKNLICMANLFSTKKYDLCLWFNIYLIVGLEIIYT